MYSLMTVSQLKVELRKKNAKTTGKKADLIERLQSFDRNQSFGADTEVEEDPPFLCPPTDTYKDINADTLLPMVTLHIIQDYFDKYGTRPKGQLLYEARHLLNARFSRDSMYIYLRGQCKASMKKVAYVVDVKLNQNGGIEECHCECAAGSGTQASCKHVSVLLFGVNEMVLKKTIKLHQSSTQKLMTFNRPHKVFYNSPVAAHHLPNKRVKTSNFEPLKEKDIMDNYKEYVRNLMIGYGDSSMPILQTYEPANPHGVEWDHYSCLEKSPQDILLEKLLLKNISSEQIKQVEKDTRAQGDCKMWHELRSCRITASMFYVVSHSRSFPKSLTANILHPNAVRTRAVNHGKVNEPIAIAKYEQEYGLEVERCGLFISAEYPFLAASPDGLLGEETVIEVKCPFTVRTSEITPGVVPYLEMCNGELTLKKTHPYYAQVQGQLYCTGRRFCNFIVYTFEDMKVIFVDREDTYINEMLITLINFYVHNLEPAVINKYMYRDYLELIKKKN